MTNGDREKHLFALLSFQAHLTLDCDRTLPYVFLKRYEKIRRQRWVLIGFCGDRTRLEEQ